MEQLQQIEVHPQYDLSRPNRYLPLTSDTDVRSQTHVLLITQGARSPPQTGATDGLLREARHHRPATAYAAEQDRLRRAYAEAYAAYFADHLPDNGVPCRFTVHVVDVPDRAASYEFSATALLQRALRPVRA